MLPTAKIGTDIFKYWFGRRTKAAQSTSNINDVCVERIQLIITGWSAQLHTASFNLAIEPCGLLGLAVNNNTHNSNTFTYTQWLKLQS